MELNFSLSFSAFQTNTTTTATAATLCTYTNMQKSHARLLLIAAWLNWKTIIFPEFRFSQSESESESECECIYVICECDRYVDVYRQIHVPT